MPPEPLPWDRKDFFKERKHERSDSLGSVARWRDSSSHHGSRDFARWGSADFRRPSGHGKQGGWHLFSEEPGHGHTPSRSGDKMPDDESCRPFSRGGDGKYSRGNTREYRGFYSQKDGKGHSWETSNGSLNAVPGRAFTLNNDQRSVDDTLMYNSHIPHSDFVNGWDQVHLKEQHDKMVSVNGPETGQRCDRENTLGSVDWKPLKWTRSGSLSSRGSGFSHSSSSKSMGVESNEAKTESQPRNSTPLQSPSGDAVACVTSAAPSEETSSRKKPRLGWGEGLAKYEKKKVDPDECVNKNGVAFCGSNVEPTHSLNSNFTDKSPRLAGLSDCASPATPSSATPSSVACSSSPGLEEKPYVKATNIDNDASNLNSSPVAGFQNNFEGFAFDLEKPELNTVFTMSSSLIEMLQCDDQISVDASFVRSTAMNKLLILRSDILKAVEMIESEIDSLENELKSLKTESGQCPGPATSNSLHVEGKSNPCIEQGAASNLISRPAPLQLDSSSDMIVEKMPFTKDALEAVHAEAKDEDIDSPGTATSKFVEQSSSGKTVSPCDVAKPADCSGNLYVSKSSGKAPCDVAKPADCSGNLYVSKSSGKAVSPCDVAKPADCSGNLYVSKSTEQEVECSVSGSREKAAISACGDGVESSSGVCVASDFSVHTDGDKKFCDLILASNKESANNASEVINKLLPISNYQIDIFRDVNVSDWQNDSSIREKFAARKRFLRFKERVITLKFRVFQHIWKEDIRLLSIRKNRTKCQKRIELSSRVSHSGHQKHRSSIRSRFSSPAGNLSLVPTNEVINFTSKLLSGSQIKLYRNTLKMPALILDNKEKLASRFISSNGLVEDPCSVEKERAMTNPWTQSEKQIFMDKLAIFGKDFRKISSFLDHKTTADCVEFYYKNHKSESFEKIKKKGKSLSTNNTYLVTSGKRWNSASLDILGDASVMASNNNKQTCSQRFMLGSCSNYKTENEKSSILNVVKERERERETVAADVLAGICGSLSSEAVSSCITSSIGEGSCYQEWKCKKVGSVSKCPLTPEVTQNVDDETCSGESCGEMMMDGTDWTDEEKSIFIQAVSSYGKDFASISQCVRTKSRDQCKVFFSKARKCLGLDLIQTGGDNVGTMSDDGNEGSDTEGACVIETGLKKDDESDPGGTIDLQKEQLDKSEVEHKAGEVEGINIFKDVENVVPKVGKISVSEGERDEVAGHVEESLAGGVIDTKASTLTKVLIDDVGEKEEVPLIETRIEDATVSGSKLTMDPTFHKPQVIMSLEQNMLVPANPAAIEYEKNRKRLLQAVEFEEIKDVFQGQPLTKHVKPSQILRGYPLQIPSKKEMNGNMTYLQKCNGSVSQHSEQTTHHRTSKRSRNGDVKLFGQILSHPKNPSTDQNNDSRCHHSKTTLAAPAPPLPKLDRNNYLGLENVPLRSYGFWDGNRIQTGFSSLPDSALLLAKYPTAFSKFPMAEQECNLNGVSVFPTGSSNGVADYQLYRGRDGTSTRMQAFAEFQRRNGFEPLGRGGIISDPVAAIKMHYAKTDEEGWGGKDMRR